MVVSALHRSATDLSSTFRATMKCLLIALENCAFVCYRAWPGLTPTWGMRWHLVRVSWLVSCDFWMVLRQPAGFPAALLITQTKAWLQCNPVERRYLHNGAVVLPFPLPKSMRPMATIMLRDKG